MSVITADRLVPIGKSSGGLRPSAVGDTFGRLAGKLLMDSVVARVTAHLRPEQIGFQVPGIQKIAKLNDWWEPA